MQALAALGPREIRLPSRRSDGAAKAGPGILELTGSPMTFPRNGEIYGEGEPADYLYKVVGGAVRTYRILSDGRRQVGDFYLPGDVFGLEAGEAHGFTAEAITAVTVLVIRRSTLVADAARDGAVARQLWAATARELQRVQDHSLLLIKTARERVAFFLLQMARRLPAAEAVDLPMTRQDIADYLGLTIETVSRTLSQLESDAAIGLPSARRVLLRDRAALAELNA